VPYLHAGDVTDDVSQLPAI